MIYLDNNASTPLDPKVFSAMKPYLDGFMGNPSSIHYYGQRARGALTQAIKTISRFFKVRTDELVFTSGATEALNLCIRSVQKGGHVVTSSLEHVAIMEPLKFCGCSVSYLDPKPERGVLMVDQVRDALQENTCMIVLTAANNETGVLTDIDPIARLAQEVGVPLVVDGVALLGKDPFVIPEGVSAMCFSGHKIHAPLGIGVAVIRKGFKIRPLILGGAQQRGVRGGTENLPAIVGLATALELLKHRGKEWMFRMESLRNRLEQGLLANLSDITIHCVEEPRVCNTSNISFLGVDGETLLMSLDLAKVAASHGAACSTGLEPSRVLLNMGIPLSVARCSIRFSLSRFNTEKEIDQSIAIITDVVARLRSF